MWRVLMSHVVSGIMTSKGDESKRDSSTAQADAFPGANAEEKESACSARNDRSELGRLRQTPVTSCLTNYVGHDVDHDVGLAVEDHDARADYAALIVRRKRRQLPG